MPAASDGSTKVVGQNYVGPKQFSSLEVRLNGEAVTRRSCANEYFLSSYVQYNSNFSFDYQFSACRAVGIFDAIGGTVSRIKAFTDGTKSLFENARTNVQSGTDYEILMPIDSTILYSNDLLPSDTSLDLSFERTTAKFSSMFYDTINQPDSSLELDDVYLILPFIKSEELFQQERVAMTRSIKVNYDDYVVKRFNVPKGTKNVMLSNLMSGPLPERLYWGLQTMDSYGGSFFSSSTLFNRNDVVKANVYRDGKQMDDYPVTMTGSHVMLPFVKFLENSNQQLNGFFSRTVSSKEFERYHFLYSSRFNSNESGSLSFEFEFGSVVASDLVLITCGQYNRTLKLDHNRNFQIV